MPELKRTSSGSWTTVVYIGKDQNGKRKYKHLTAPTKRELLDVLARTRETLNPDNLNIKKMTVKDAIDGYIERKRLTASPKTIREYLSYSKTSFQNLHPVKIWDLNDTICQKEIDAYAKYHSPKSVSNRWGLVKAAVSFYDKDFNPRVELPPVKRKRLEMPDKDTLIQLLENIQGDRIEIPILLAITCGMRRGEIAALDFNTDVDYERCMININKDMVIDEHNNWVIKEPKTEAGNRIIPCPKWVVDKIREARDNPKYQPYKSPNSITKKFHQLAKKNKIGCSFHGLRHYYASIMDALGIPENYQMARLGHTTNEMLRRYQEYLKYKEVEINESLMTHFNDLQPKSHATNMQQMRNENE